MLAYWWRMTRVAMPVVTSCMRGWNQWPQVERLVLTYKCDYLISPNGHEDTVALGGSLEDHNLDKSPFLFLLSSGLCLSGPNLIVRLFTADFDRAKAFTYSDGWYFPG